MPPKPYVEPKRTHPLWWCAAIICTIITTAVIIVGISVFVGYLVIHPRVPFISVVGAHLDRFQYDLAGVLVTQVTIVLRSENDNTRAHARFSGLNLALIFEGKEIAKLISGPYEVSKNNSVDFNYVVASAPIPLNPQQMQTVGEYLNEDLIRFNLRGSARAQWKVGLLGSVGFWCHLNCQLKFHQSDGSYVASRCTSRAK